MNLGRFFRLRLALPLVAAAFAATGGVASACLPPPPDFVPPTDEERVRGAADWATDIVYGVIVGSSRNEDSVRFRVVHVYKGDLRPGSIVRASFGWGLDPPMCFGMLGGPPPLPRGTYGVVAFRSDRPKLNFLSDREVQLMLDAGLIRSARRGR